MSNPKRTMAATMLLLEAFSVFFGALAAGRLPGSPGLGRMLALMGGLALALVLTAGILRRPGGYLIGSLLQVVVRPAGEAS